MINWLFQFWIEADWSIALVMSVAVNIAVFVSTAFILDVGIGKLVTKYQWGSYIDERELKSEQKKMEFKFGITACIIFAACSLITRELFDLVWPSSFLSLISQIIIFVLFYETYSYFVHRLLHTKPFLKVHGVHHRSVRVTPWSAYSVHPVEALFIGMSAPVFMSLFSLSLGVALVLHVLGMMFTILLHSNFRLSMSNSILNQVGNYPAYHSSHHILGKVNFGFVNSFWDRCFKTRAKVS
ncbi:sterol desaturase family protein [Aliikangiella coralliicola]|uniref:Sterol desaturase family protein n=1 Tax=Aliikangiella coralliicola TaxID=2592383 RepID=A0A545UCH5_9GAMM|nr:sterol desaturase family protein [Aliikangiella coralliicola]TQV87168.1 sterol desaturase family protein [Aliikangiella coralliicola]